MVHSRCMFLLNLIVSLFHFFFSSRRRHTRLQGDWSSDVCSSDLACVRHLVELPAHGYDAQRFCRDLLEHFRHLAVLAATGDRALVAELPEAEVAALAAQAGRRSADDLQRFFRLLLEADEALAAPARSVDPKLVLEMCVVRLATLPPLLPLDDILHRLEAFGAGNPAAPGGRA